MYINLLGYWWGIQWVLNMVILRPRTAVNIEVPEIHTFTFDYRVPPEIQKHNSMIFHDQPCNFHYYLMYSLQPPLLAASSLR